MYSRPAFWRRQVRAAEGHAGNESDLEDRQGPTCAFSQNDRKQMDEERGARHPTQDERHRRTSGWLQAHWAAVLPQAHGKFLAIAGQEPFLADTPAEAWARVEAAHPEDTGAIVRYIRPEAGPRIQAD